MRVISGEARGRRLIAPRGLSTRPTSDRVRETVFDVLAFRWNGGRVLDVFAGTGALGIEALSRGAEAAVFVENQAEALQAVAANIKACRFEPRATVRRGDFRHVLKMLSVHGERFSLVFVDPPYESGYYDETISLLPPLLEKDAYVVLESVRGAPPPSVPEEWMLYRQRTIGHTLISIYHYA